MKGPDGKYLFGLVRIGDKGQIVIPKEARDVFGLKPGDQLLMIGDEKQGIALVDPTALGLFKLMGDPPVPSFDEPRNPPDPDNAEAQTGKEQKDRSKEMNP